MILTFRSLETQQPWGKYGNMFPKTLQSLGEPKLNICIVLSSGSIVFRTAQTKNCLLFHVTFYMVFVSVWKYFVHYAG